MLSTPNPGGDAAYRYDAVYLHYPQSVIKESNGIRRFTFGALSRTAYFDGVRDQPMIMRTARCRVPDSDRAEQMAREYLKRFPTAPDGVQWTGETVGNPTTSATSSKAAKGWECQEYEVYETYCFIFTDGTEICIVEVTCTQWMYVQEDDGDGGVAAPATTPAPATTTADLPTSSASRAAAPFRGHPLIENPADQPHSSALPESRAGPPPRCSARR